MSIIEYMYNIFSVLCIIDVIYCYYQIGKNIALVELLGLDNFTKNKLRITIIVSILYIFYLIYKFVQYVF